MFKSRNFFIGLGLGLIVASVLLMIYGGSFTKPKEFTLDELRQLAEQQSLTLYTEDELNELKSQIEQEITVKQGSINDSVNSNNNNNTDNTNTDNQNNITKSVEFTIKDGMDSFDVADYLIQVGILKDDQKFQEILSKNKLDTQIIAGNYQCEDSISIINLIELITDTKQENWIAN